MIPAFASTQTHTAGRFRIHAIQAGGQKLDGGAMFGVVPKPLWEKRIPPDERNRIGLGMRCLLVEHDDGLVLIDTGLGNKENAKFREIYGVENEGAGGGTWLEDGLRALGFGVEDVRTVINTHLHFDHAGGNTCVLPSGEVVPTFPKARYVVQQGEHHWATHTNERTGASYFGANWDPVIGAGRFEFIDGDKEIVPGISTVASPGHTPFHQSVLVDGGNGERVLFLGDVCPTSAHLPLPWIMGYDVEPLVTLESKRRLLPRAVDEGWLLVFEHDASVAWSRIAHDGKAFRVA
ncbi:MAG: MBL fold metallo-hydrolase [Cytophagaceae bacterium]|nr:MBL fold metallo-hydrolase [Gemmatimonadaceae bacterium]